jgi:hypothetical protein
MFFKNSNKLILFHGSKCLSAVRCSQDKDENTQRFLPADPSSHLSSWPSVLQKCDIPWHPRAFAWLFLLPGVLPFTLSLIPARSSELGSVSLP